MLVCFTYLTRGADYLACTFWIELASLLGPRARVHALTGGSNRDNGYTRTARLQLMREAINYASTLNQLNRLEEAKSLLRKVVPVARRVLGDSNDVTLQLQWIYGRVLYRDDGATLDDLREAVTTLEETKRTTRRVMGGAHPTAAGIERDLHNARVALRAREAPTDELDEVENA